MTRPVLARMSAALLDGLVILGWLAAVAAVFVPLYLADRNPLPADGGLAHLVAFAMSVLPAWLYLSVGEAGAAHATWGKRRMGLHVTRRGGGTPGVPRVIVRNAIKLLPWQLAHLGVAPLIADPEAGGLAVWLSLGAAYALVGVTVGLVLLRRDRAALHDLVAGTLCRPVGRTP